MAKWDEYIVEETTPQADKWSQYIVEEQPIAETQPQPSNLGGVLTGLGLGAGAVAGVRYGIKKGYEFFRQPKVRAELKGVKSQLLDIQKQIPSEIGMPSIEGTEPSFIPQKLNQVSQGLKQQLNAFDETLISLNAKDLADTIKTNYSTWIKSATNAYGAGLDQLDTYFIKSGKTISTDNFTKLLDNVIKKAESGGKLPQEYSTVSRLKSLLEPKEIKSGLVDIYGKPAIKYEVRQMPFSEVKGYVSSLVSENPYSATSGMLREEWGNYLQQNAPKEISEKLGQMNKQYQKFAQARTQLSRVVDPQTGEFNTSKLNNYLIKYTKQRVDEGIVDLMKMLGEGSDLTQPIKGVSKKFGALSKLRTKRFQNEEAIKQQINKINQLRSQSQELISRGKVTQAKLDNRSLAKSLTKLFGLGRKTIPFLMVVPQIIDAVRFSKDPLGYIASMETGIPQEKLMESKKKYREGTMTFEEKVAAGLAI